MKLQKEFAAPRGVNAFKTIVVRELDGTDEVLIALWCGLRQYDKSSPLAELQVQREEAIRMSVVSVDGNPVNLKGVPWPGFNKLTRRELLAIARFHDDLNGLDTKDLEKCVAAGKPVISPQPNEEAASTGGPGEG
jgi:hypothetical protein